MYGSNNMKKSVVFNNQFNLKFGGQFELENGGQFAPELVVNLHWKVVVNLTGFSKDDIKANIKEIILCHENKSDIDEIKPKYIEGLTFHYVKEMSEVLKIAITDQNVKNAKVL